MSFLKVHLKDISLDPLSYVNDSYIEWMNDSEVNEYNSHSVFPYTWNQGEKYIQSLNENNIAFRILKDRVWIGNAAIQDINYINRSADLAVLIGNKNEWGKGIATDVFTLLINYGFYTLNLHRLTAGVITENKAMMRVCEKVGMIQEGIRKDALYKLGDYYDAAMWAIIRKEFQ